MSLRLRIPALSRLLVMVFMILQGLSLAHAADYGSDAHEHDGMVCLVGTQIEADEIVPLPMAATASRASSQYAPVVYETYFTSAHHISPPARAPPPRAPPVNP